MQAHEKKADETWQAFRKGSRQAFAKIYRDHVRELLNYGYKVTSDYRLIEDSIQDLFVELWQSRTRLSETTSVRFYLFRALRYKIVRNSKMSDESLVSKLDVIEGGLYEASHESYLIGVEVQSLQMANLRELISNLPGRQQEAINLRYYHDFSNEEIAHIMGVNYQSACKILYSALKRLKVNLQVSITSWLLPIFFLALMD